MFFVNMISIKKYIYIYKNIYIDTETTRNPLKNEKKEFDIQWKIVARAKPFSPVSGICALCTLEKFYILTKPNLATLNRNEEIYNTCRHKLGLLLDKT